MSKMIDQGKEEVTRLCRYFATNRQAFLSPGVKEAHVRQSLIDPLFEALGWDVAMAPPQAITRSVFGSISTARFMSIASSTCSPVCETSCACSSATTGVPPRAKVA